MIQALIRASLASLLLTVVSAVAFAQTTGSEPLPGASSVTPTPTSTSPAVSPAKSATPAKINGKEYSAAMTREWQALDQLTATYLEMVPKGEFLRIINTAGRCAMVTGPYGRKGVLDDRRPSIKSVSPATVAHTYTSDSTLDAIVDWFSKKYEVQFIVRHTALTGAHAGDTLTVARGVKRFENTIVSIMIWNPTLSSKGKKGAKALTEKTSVTVQERAFRPRDQVVFEGPDAVVELTWKVPYGDLIQKMAVKYQIDPHLIAALVQQESNFNATAMSVDSALGLTQMIPGTAAMMGVSDPTNPKQSLDGGVRYLKLMFTRFKGNVSFALAAYNAGPGNVEKYKGIPPFAETRDYVRRIMARYYEKVTGKAPPVTAKTKSKGRG